MEYGVHILALVDLARGSVSVLLRSSLEASIAEEVLDLCSPLLLRRLEFELDPSAVFVMCPWWNNDPCDFVSVCSEDILLATAEVGVYLAGQERVLRDLGSTRVLVQW